jgi:dihydropteroate synthase
MMQQSLKKKGFCIMGIINLSPQSFYHATPNYDDALRLAEQMSQDGADILDIGAIATNPKIAIESDIPSVQSELDIVIPFVEKLSKNIDTKMSVDTFRTEVMRESISAGAHMINDQRALTQDYALETAVKLNVPVCLMHHFNPPRIAGSSSKENLLSQIILDLKKYADRCLSAGMSKDNIILDPGFGGGSFGKNAEENFYLLSQLEKITALDFPVLVGFSRKSFLGELINADSENRLYASITAAAIAVQKGVSIVRVHDVKATKDALSVVKKLVDIQDDYSNILY